MVRACRDLSCCSPNESTESKHFLVHHQVYEQQLHDSSEPDGCSVGAAIGHQGCQSNSRSNGAIFGSSNDRAWPEILETRPSVELWPSGMVVV